MNYISIMYFLQRILERSEIKFERAIGEKDNLHAEIQGQNWRHRKNRRVTGKKEKKKIKLLQVVVAR